MLHRMSIEPAAGSGNVIFTCLPPYNQSIYYYYVFYTQAMYCKYANVNNNEWRLRNFFVPNFPTCASCALHSEQNVIIVHLYVYRYWLCAVFRILILFIQKQKKKNKRNWKSGYTKRSYDASVCVPTIHQTFLTKHFSHNNNKIYSMNVPVVRARAIWRTH